MALNEGRSLNPGDTTVMDDSTTRAPAVAQRRPESEPRRHVDDVVAHLDREARSTKAGV